MIQPPLPSPASSQYNRCKDNSNNAIPRASYGPTHGSDNSVEMNDKFLTTGEPSTPITPNMNIDEGLPSQSPAHLFPVQTVPDTLPVIEANQPHDMPQSALPTPTPEPTTVDDIHMPLYEAPAPAGHDFHHSSVDVRPQTPHNILRYTRSLDIPISGISRSLDDLRLDTVSIDFAEPIVTDHPKSGVKHLLKSQSPSPVTRHKRQQVHRELPDDVGNISMDTNSVFSDGQDSQVARSSPPVSTSSAPFGLVPPVGHHPPNPSSPTALQSSNISPPRAPESPVENQSPSCIPCSICFCFEYPCPYSCRRR